MKIFTAKQLKEADNLSIKKQGISSEELMERAGTQVFRVIHQRLEGTNTPIKIFCGIGNNGGDGLVIGRLLIEQGHEVTMYVVNYSDKRSKNFLLNYDRVKNVTKKWPILLTSEDDFPELNSKDFVVDAIFGIGLNRPLVPWVGNLISYINKSGAFILSIDMPSGLFPDAPTKDKESIIIANHTMTFQAPKLAFFLPETAKYAGEMEVIDIGLDQEFLASTATRAQLIGKRQALKLYRPREKFSHKGTYGHALIIGGSYGKIGSVSLTGTATLRSGAGMLTFFIPKCGYSIVQTLLPEAMVITDKAENFISEIEFDLEPEVISFGVGVGQEPETMTAFEKLLDKVQKPMLIDADGLNLLSKNELLLEKIPKASVLTPHPKELERLIGKWKNDFHKLEMAQAFVKKYGVFLVIKGAYTITVAEEALYVNTTGNPGMATAGSGDVLTGVITGLISQGYEPLAAAVFGVYLHGRAGDLAANKLSFQGMIAGDIAANIPGAFLDLFRKENPPKSKNPKEK
ncbi:MAG TPA: NAD(P)H-hydrate dehydratase [Salinimicrobium sp.]|nr:NAD(P)H-hydrate dehydratase [Salinimicrobium sp.]